MRIPIVVVTLNSARYLPKWLRSVRNLNHRDGFDFEPFIVDNGSWDRTPAIIWEAIQDGVIQHDNVIWLPNNTGFNAAQNLAFRKLGTRADVRFVATLNHDAWAEPDWLQNLVDKGMTPSAPQKVGMWGGLILRDDCHDRISSAGHWLRSRDGAFLDIDWNRRINAPNAAPLSHHDDNPFSPCFAAALWSMEMISEVGLPDTDQFLYYDDVDLAFRARLSNWEARFVKDARAYHPLPNSKVRNARVKQYQTEGRLMMVSRYFPEPTRSRILDNLNHEEREAFGALLELRSTPVGKETERRRVFDEWKDRNCTASSL